METLERQNLVNRISEIYPEHTLWIKEQFNKKKFVYTRGREVLINAPGRNLKKIVNIPPKEDPSYKIAWINVYNLCLDYLEGTINAACLENKFIQRMGNSWTLNGHTIVWPKFNPTNADYARGLEEILDEYILVKSKYIRMHSKSKKGVDIKKTSVKIDMPHHTQKVKKNEEYKNNLNLKYKLTSFVKKLPKKANTNEIVDNYTVKNSFRVNKVSDGDILSGKDVRNLKETSDMVLITCMNVLNPKEEDVFFRNAFRCIEVDISVGAFVYGTSTDEKEASQELKRLIQMLQSVSTFSGLIVYSVNNEYIGRNRDGDIKLLNYINTCNYVMSALRKIGYTPILSMNLNSKSVIDDIYRRYNMQNENEVLIMTIVRDIERIDKKSSVIVVDPWNDYDCVEIKNSDLLDSLENVSVKKH